VARFLAKQIPERRLLLGLLVASSAGLVLLAVARSFWPFGVLRGAQCLIVNAARVGSGCVAATTVLATGSAGLLYVTLGLAGFAPAFLLRRA
jgi:hypothetical protein